MGKTFQDLLNNGQAQVLGIVSPVPMGNWLSTTQYQKLNLVRHNTATYIARTSNQNIEPGVADNWATYWMLICIDGGQVSPDGEYPEMSVGSVMHALLWGNKSYDGSSTQTITAADLGLADVYKPQGSVTFANLPATPNESNYGYVWNISDDFTTDSRFLEGAGKACPAGTNVGVIEQDGVYYYDILGAFMDLSNYAEIDGSYPTLGAGYLCNTASISITTSENNNWFHIASLSGASLGNISAILLVNIQNPWQHQSNPNTGTGIIEVDVRISENAGISILAGNLLGTDVCVTFNLDEDIADVYLQIRNSNPRAKITVFDFSSNVPTASIALDNTFYGTSAPSGAVYAVNRNNAAKVENALTIIKDGVSTVYDGSEAKTVEITENGGITVIEIPANESDTLTSEQLQQVKNNPQNTVLRRTVSPEMNEIYCFDSVTMTQGADSAYTFRNVTSMAQDSLTLQAISVNLNSGVWIYSSVQTSAGGGGSGITIVTIPQDGVSTNPVMSGTIELASPENTVIKIYNGEDNDGARYTYSILTSFDENASGDVPEYVYSGEDYIVTCTKSNGNTYNYTLNATTTSTEQKAISLSNLQKFKELCDQTYAKTGGGGSGGGTQLYRQTIRYTSGSDLGYFSIITTTATPYTNGADIYNDWNNVVSAKYGANAAGHDTCLFVDDDSAVYVGFDGIHTTNFPPMKVWTTASVTPL